MTKDEALTMALEALDQSATTYFDKRDAAIIAIKEALARPVQPLADAARQSWELHLAQAAEIRELLDIHAPETEGNLQTRLAQVFAQPVPPDHPEDSLDMVAQPERGLYFKTSSNTGCR